MHLRIKRWRRRRRRNRNWHSLAIRMGQWALNGVTVASLLFLGWNIYQYLLCTGKLNVGEIRIIGCLNAKEGELLDLARLDVGMEIWKLNLQELSQRLSRHPWVEKVQVRRDWARRALIIEVQERIPRALILLDDLYLVDSQGKIFKKVGAREQVDLPVLTGLKAKEVQDQDKEAMGLIKEALKLLDLLAYRPFFNQGSISEINLHKQKGLTIYTLERGLPIHIGWGDYKDKLQRLEKVLPDIQKKGEEVEYVDLNHPRKVILKIKEQSKQAQQTKPYA